MSKPLTTLTEITRVAPITRVFNSKCSPSVIGLLYKQQEYFYLVPTQQALRDTPAGWKPFHIIAQIRRKQDAVGITVAHLHKKPQFITVNVELFNSFKFLKNPVKRLMYRDDFNKCWWEIDFDQFDMLKEQFPIEDYGGKMKLDRKYQVPVSAFTKSAYKYKERNKKVVAEASPRVISRDVISRQVKDN